ncbi:hypothetical protein [Roseivirga sp.]|uniref:hypothetical protein n=1 Tax=Roseivirga sp. TaxID=1964215 RepID=UPI003B521FB0
MKQILTLILFCSMTTGLFGQWSVEKNYKLEANEKLSLDFEYPEIVKISTWDKQEVQINARVLINGNDATEDFEISDRRNSGRLSVSSKLRNLNKYDRRNIIISDDDDDDKVSINSKGNSITIGKSGKNGKSYYNGTEIEIVVEVILPKNAVVDVQAKYGMVEVVDAPQEIEVWAKYGGADIKVDEASIRSLEASTDWGQIFSNLNSKLSVGGDDMIGKNMRARLSNNKGSSQVRVESEYGNVYLRKN